MADQVVLLEDGDRDLGLAPMADAEVIAQQLADEQGTAVMIREPSTRELIGIVYPRA